jgi:hypothetical protein
MGQKNKYKNLKWDIRIPIPAMILFMNKTKPDYTSNYEQTRIFATSKKYRPYGFFII